MAGLALALFVALVAFGGQYFGWDDANGYIQASLVATFVFGMICGYRVRQ